MLRNKGLRGPNRFYDSEVNPMEGIANLVDVMLVFACGLMIAIIMFWNVDLSNVSAVIDQKQLKEVPNLEERAKGENFQDSLENKGAVYKDPKTGKLYIIEEKK